jgi:hypothetical protein
MNHGPAANVRASNEIEPERLTWRADRIRNKRSERNKRGDWIEGQPHVLTNP